MLYGFKSIDLMDQCIQIIVLKDSSCSKKIIDFALKHFSKQSYKLSNSLLILEEGEKLKKTYFLQWVYHTGLCVELKDDLFFDKLLANSQLPIRIKIIEEFPLLQKVKIYMHWLNPQVISFSMLEQNKLAKRYILNTFRDSIVGYAPKEIFLDAGKLYFWENLMQTLNKKVINNILLEFDYDTFSKPSFKSYMTKEDLLLKESYSALGCNYGADFVEVKARFLKLAKEFHPDMVFGNEKNIVDLYTQRFRNIQQAYKTIKYRLRHVA